MSLSLSTHLVWDPMEHPISDVWALDDLSLMQDSMRSQGQSHAMSCDAKGVLKSHNLSHDLLLVS